MSEGAWPTPSAPPLDWRRALPVIDTGSAILREPRLSDAAMLAQALGNKRVARFMAQPPASAGGFERFIAWLQNERQVGRSFCYGIVPAGKTHAVGVIQVRRLEPGFGTAEWGFALGPAYWGTGLFMPAARAVADFVFRHAGTRRLEARATVENGRGNGVLKKLGAVPEGLLRGALPLDRGVLDQILWALIDEDWYALNREAAGVLMVDAPRPPEVEPPAERQSVVPAWRALMPAIGDATVQVRELRVSDAPRLLEVLREPATQEFVLPPPPTRDDFERYLTWTDRQRQAGRYLGLAIVPAGGSDAVGLIEVRQLDPGFRTADWGFFLDRRFWGTGLFVRAARHTLAFLFEQVGVHRLEARVAVSNPRGNGVLRKLGATREGVMRRSFLHAGQYVDDALWSLLVDEWLRREPAQVGARRRA